MFSPLIIAFVLSPILALCGGNTTLATKEHHRRAADTCADPTLAKVYLEGYNPGIKAHNLELQFFYATINTEQNGGWQVEAPLFRAWKDPEQFTTPLYQFKNTAQTDVMYLTSTTGNPPTVPGFALAGNPIVAYVYSTQICGSVPLFGAFQATFSDHWYTTDSGERDALVTGGWTDLGIIAFVLPLNSDCACTT